MLLFAGTESKNTGSLLDPGEEMTPQKPDTKNMWTALCHSSQNLAWSCCLTAGISLLKPLSSSTTRTPDGSVAPLHGWPNTVTTSSYKQSDWGFTLSLSSAKSHRKHAVCIRDGSRDCVRALRPRWQINFIKRFQKPLSKEKHRLRLFETFVIQL